MTLLDGIEHLRAGRVSAAREVFASHAGDPRALYLHGLSHLGAGEPSAALPLLREACARGHGAPGVLLNLVRAAVGAGAPEAVENAERLTDRDIGCSEAWLLLGTALNAAARPAEAETALRRAVALDPVSAQAHLNLGNSLADLDRMVHAEAEIEAALALDPSLVEAETSLGFVLASMGRLGEAVAACRRAVAIRPTYARAHWNEGVAHLLAGNWEAGWDKYEWRKRHEQFGTAFLSRPQTPEWDGGSLAGRTILVLAEQGAGDTIMLARFLPLLAGLGARVVLACDPALHTLLSPLAAGMVEQAARPLHDCWIDQMSLPRVFGTRPDTVPAAGGYLPLQVRPRGLSPTRIGIVWAGNPAHHNDRRRSIAADQLDALLGTESLEFVSLQQGARQGETSLPSIACESYADTAQALTGIDLLITVDTSIAHLAGALGVPCWVMLAHAPDWRWMLGRDNTPWYDSVRLFRQPAPGDWCDVLDRVREALGQRACWPRSSHRNATVNRASPVPSM